MVMGPGGYRFGDYWKLGLPLLVLYGVVAILPRAGVLVVLSMAHAADRDARRSSRPATCRRPTVRGARGRGARALPRRRRGRDSDVYPALARCRADALRHLRRRHRRRRLRGRRRRRRVHDHERRRSRSCSRSSARRSGPSEARERLGVNATGLPFDSLAAVEQSAGRPHEPDGQLRRDRDDEPRAGRDAEDEVAVHPRRALALRRPRAALDDEVYARRRRRTTATGASPACSRPTAGSTATRPRRPTSTRGSARLSVTAHGSRGDGRDARRRRRQPAHRRARGRRRDLPATRSR